LSKRIYTRAFATARFWGDNLDPLLITQTLLLPPDTQHRRGEPRLIRTKAGEIEQRSPFRTGAWTMSSEKWVDSPQLHIHLEWLLEQLEPRRQAILEIVQQGVSADFFCYSSGSTQTPPAIPRTIRDRANTLSFHIEIDHYDTSVSTENEQ